MRPTAPENRPLTGQLHSPFEKLHGIGSTELHPDGRRQALQTVGGKVAVEIVEPGFERHNRNAQGLGPLDQGQQCRRPGGVVIARDVEAAQVSGKVDGGEMGG